MTPDERDLACTVNGTAVRMPVPVRRLLSDLLREDLGLTALQLGCEDGVCGACTILLDGDPVRACTMLAVQADGHDLVTLEGLQDDPFASEAKRAFSQAHALQCGFCTSGMLTTLVGCRRAGCDSGEEALHELSGNLCRCTGYLNIRRAVRTLWREGEAQR
ncbi:MAG: aerobic carbon-monoxide dehydrogenase small subunit [Actinomycetota bacterium]|jgi:carbon-monoxide dehydrogenase small subunit|nr:aerobic carbon-monoxide dehydrogenase small subunit [Actinomycetota bacterium]